MIKITDITLSCLDEYNASSEQLSKFCELLLGIGSDFIELSAAAYEKIGKLPQNGKYILKLKSSEDAKRFNEFDRYVCRRIGGTHSPSVIFEVQANDIREIYSLKQYQSVENIRITGLDDILSHDYITAFNSIKSILHGRIELCPEDKYYCATAIAVEWIMQGGNYIAASFAGIGSKAALEEVLMSLRLEKRHKPNISFDVFPKIKALFEEITGIKITNNKAIIGKNIFDIEAGIHADGISKDPKIYEPYSPELVGNSRKLVIGKHSGKTAVILKLKELGIGNEGINIDLLLKSVQKMSILKQSSLSDMEFQDLCHYLKVSK